MEIVFILLVILCIVVNTYLNDEERMGAFFSVWFASFIVFPAANWWWNYFINTFKN